ncbi:MAG: DUF4340 domain-containing protein [Planctomycetota bacterium]|jgi:hypothetical protein
MRSIALLSALLAIQIALLVPRFLASNDEAGARTISQPERGARLIDFTADQVSSITLRKKSGDELVIAREGTGFVLESLGGIPTRGSLAQDFLRDVLALRSERVVASTAANHAELEVSKDAPAGTVTLTGGEGQTLAVIYLGRATKGGELMRLEGSDRVHRVRGPLAAPLARSATAWVDNQLVTFDKLRAVSVAWFEGDTERFRFDRQRPEGNEEAFWTGPEAATPIDLDRLQGVIETLSNLRFETPVGLATLPEHGLKPAEQKIEVTLEDGEKVRLLVGAIVDQTAAEQEQRRFVKLQGKPTVAILHSRISQQLLNEPGHYRVEEEAPEAAAPTAPMPKPAPPNPDGATPKGP